MAKRAFGFRDAEGDPTGLVTVLLASGNSTIIGIGDAVILEGSAGGIGRGGVVPTVARGAATGALFGYIASLDQASATTPNFNQKYRPASTAMYAQVVPFKPNHKYAIRADAALAVTNVGENVNLATITNADTVTGQSKMEVSASSAATSQTAYQMTLVGVEDDGTNEITDDTPVVFVQMNNIQVFPGFGGV